MDQSAAKPRSVLSILFIGVLLGPHFLMLWLGKWKWAVLYLLVIFGAGYVVDFLVAGGVLPRRPVFSFFAPGDLAVLIISDGIGIVHGLAIRKAALNRPWYRWIAAVPAFKMLVALVLFIPVRVYVAEPFYIPSQSNEPNLMVGDYVFVSKTAYGYSRYSFPFHLATFQGRIGGHLPQRGDMAVFKLPTDTDIDYVKRIVGLPGDHVQMKAGILYINDVPVKLDPVEIASELSGKDSGASAPTYFHETLPNGRSYFIANIVDNGSADNTDVYVVPPGHYFVLDDNRDNSQDSRFLGEVGYVPEDNFIGPVVLLFWNSEGVPISRRSPETPATGQ